MVDRDEVWHKSSVFLCKLIAIQLSRACYSRKALRADKSSALEIDVKIQKSTESISTGASWQIIEAQTIISDARGRGEKIGSRANIHKQASTKDRLLSVNGQIH